MNQYGDSEFVTLLFILSCVWHLLCVGSRGCWRAGQGTPRDALGSCSRCEGILHVATADTNGLLCLAHRTRRSVRAWLIPGWLTGPCRHCPAPGDSTVQNQNEHTSSDRLLCRHVAGQLPSRCTRSSTRARRRARRRMWPRRCSTCPPRRSMPRTLERSRTRCMLAHLIITCGSTSADERRACGAPACQYAVLFAGVASHWLNQCMESASSSGSKPGSKTRFVARGMAGSMRACAAAVITVLTAVNNAAQPCRTVSCCGLRGSMVCDARRPSVKEWSHPKPCFQAVPHAVKDDEVHPWDVYVPTWLPS